MVVVGRETGRRTVLFNRMILVCFFVSGLLETFYTYYYRGHFVVCTEVDIHYVSLCKIVFVCTLNVVVIVVAKDIIIPFDSLLSLQKFQFESIDCVVKRRSVIS